MKRSKKGKLNFSSYSLINGNYSVGAYILRKITFFFLCSYRFIDFIMLT